MAKVIVKHEDRYRVQWKANMDLTLSTTRLLARKVGPGANATIELAHAVIDAEAGLVEHLLDGSLAIGSYQIELEASRPNGEIITFPNEGYETLVIAPDLDQ